MKSTILVVSCGVPILGSLSYGSCGLKFRSFECNWFRSSIALSSVLLSDARAGSQCLRFVAQEDQVLDPRNDDDPSGPSRLTKVFSQLAASTGDQIHYGYVFKSEGMLANGIVEPDKDVGARLIRKELASLKTTQYQAVGVTEDLIHAALLAEAKNLTAKK